MMATMLLLAAGMAFGRRSNQLHRPKHPERLASHCQCIYVTSVTSDNLFRVNCLLKPVRSFEFRQYELTEEQFCRFVNTAAQRRIDVTKAKEIYADWCRKK